MRFHASHERACRTAKRLRDVANAHVRADRPILLSDAQRALAAAWGYASWTELLQGSEDAPRSPLDEDAGIEAAAGRAEAHADALATTLDVGLPLARAIVAGAGLTARTPPSRPETGRGTPVVERAAGTGGLLLGHDTATGDGVRLPYARARRHVTLCGGDGKARAAFGLAMAARHIAGGAACIHVDASGDDASVHARLSAAARTARHADDFLVLDLRGMDAPGYLAGTAPALNPFATGDAEVLMRFLRDLVGGPYGEDPTNDFGTEIWTRRTVSMMECVMRALVFLRDAGLLDLDAGTIRDHLSLRRITDLADPMRFPEMPPDLRKGLRGYLESLPGFHPMKGYRQAQTTLDHHGYLEMVFTRSLADLADVHGDVFGYVSPDAVDAGRRMEFADVVVERRILLVLLPEKGEPSYRQGVPGSVVVALLQRAMRQLSGEEVDPRWAEAVRRRVPGKGIACAVYLDDFDAYGAARLDTMAALARSLGLSLTFSMQGKVDTGGFADPTPARAIAASGTAVLMGDGARGMSRMASILGNGVAEDGLPLLEEGEAYVLAGDDLPRRVMLAG